MPRHMFTAAVVIVLAVAPAAAGTITLNLTNSSGSGISSVTAVPKGGAAEATTQNALTSPIADGETGTAEIAAPDGACVFDLAITLATGKAINQPNTDICQVDTIIVE